MKYTVTVEGKVFEIEIDAERVRLDGCEVSAKLIAAPRLPIRRLVIGDQSTILTMKREQSGWSVSMVGTTRSVTVEDERARRLREVVSDGESAITGGTVRAPMPGLVLRVEVEEGQSIDVGTGLVVLEAMKMENEIKSPAGGRVSSIQVTAGQAVEKGAVLVEVDVQG